MHLIADRGLVSVCQDLGIPSQPLDHVLAITANCTKTKNSVLIPRFGRVSSNFVLDFTPVYFSNFSLVPLRTFSSLAFNHVDLFRDLNFFCFLLRIDLAMLL